MTKPPGLSSPRYLSLFSGIGGLDLGLDRAGWQCVGQCEWDPWCRRVLEKHWPDVPKFQDVRDLGQAQLQDLGRIDAIVGGFPCQDISIANKTGAGLDGKKSGLWSEFARLIKLARPRVVCAENVPNLRNRGIDRVLADLERLGYAAWPVVVGAKDLGAPHTRKRVFIIAMADPMRDGQWAPWFGREPASKVKRARSTDPHVLADAAAGRRQSKSTQPRLTSSIESWPSPTATPCRTTLWPSGPGDPQAAWEPSRLAVRAQRGLGGGADGIPPGSLLPLAHAENIAHIRAYGNAVCPVVAEAIGHAINAAVETIDGMQPQGQRSRRHN